MTTVAPGIAAPEASVMVPLIDPPTTCACNGAALITSAATIPAMADDAMERIALISRSRDENDVGQEERLEPINSGDAPSPSGDNNNTRNNQWRGSDRHG